MGAGRQSMHEAFETNVDISTRDRSREGAEEAIDLSRRFQKPELKTRPPGRAGARAAVGRGGDKTWSPCSGRSAKSVIDSETSRNVVSGRSPRSSLSSQGSG